VQPDRDTVLPCRDNPRIVENIGSAVRRIIGELKAGVSAIDPPSRADSDGAMGGDGCFSCAMDAAVDEEIVAQPAEEAPAILAISGNFGALPEDNGIAVPDDECALTLSINRRKWIARIDTVNRHSMPR
jgi:hypothetical protein